MEIVLLRLDRIGDFVLGIPAYRALRKAYPNDHLTVVVPPAVAELAKPCPYFDEIYLYDAQWLKPGALRMDRWGSALKLIRFLRSKEIGLLLDFRYQNRMDPFITGLSGAKERVGFDVGLPSWFLTKKAPQPPQGMHQVDRNLSLLAALGIMAVDKRLEIWWDEHDLKTAEAHLPSQELLPGIPRIMVHIGSGAPSKRWGEESFEVLLHELHASTQAEILVMGGEEDLPFAHDVLDGLECPVVNLVGKLSLRQMAALMKDCKLFIGCDSGPAHVAAASGVPVISLFSAANEVEVWKPWGDKVTIMTRHPECSPCRRHECPRTDGYFCMSEIGADEVVEEAKRILGKA
ncbi:MAG TPA: glycosyltransferase family 9 protein [bacterium]|nr:glycosyltransferase family 9 protein [bacterium]